MQKLTPKVHRTLLDSQENRFCQIWICFASSFSQHPQHFLLITTGKYVLDQIHIL